MEERGRSLWLQPQQNQHTDSLGDTVHEVTAGTMHKVGTLLMPTVNFGYGREVGSHLLAPHNGALGHRTPPSAQGFRGTRCPFTFVLADDRRL